MGMEEDALKLAADIEKDDPGLAEKVGRWVEGLVVHLVHLNGARTVVAAHPEAGITPVPAHPLGWQNPVVGVEIPGDENGEPVTQPVKISAAEAELAAPATDEALSSPAALSGLPTPPPAPETPPAPEPAPTEAEPVVVGATGSTTGATGSVTSDTITPAGPTSSFPAPVPTTSTS